MVIILANDIPMEDQESMDKKDSIIERLSIYLLVECFTWPHNSYGQLHMICCDLMNLALWEGAKDPERVGLHLSEVTSIAI